MKEIGIDISGHTSKHMNEFLNRKIDTVITVCGNADQACPMFPGQVNRYHWGFDDPAHATGTEEEILAGIPPCARSNQAGIRGLRRRISREGKIKMNITELKDVLEQNSAKGISFILPDKTAHSRSLPHYGSRPRPRKTSSIAAERGVRPLLASCRPGSRPMTRITR